MIARIWHGYTTPENADAYQHLLETEVFREIRGKNISGFIKIKLLRRELIDEIEFVTIMYFDDLIAVREFAGDDYSMAYVPHAARQILKHFDDRSQHYEVVM